ncbi:MAG: ferredoxin [Aerococcaceae bacterium]|nr:ferredoxin [Aerococcaceae bacterium]
MKKLSIISEKCIACGKCYLNYPDVFDCDDDGIAFALDEATPEQVDAGTRAIYECPTKAIQLSDV